MDGVVQAFLDAAFEIRGADEMRAFAIDRLRARVGCDDAHFITHTKGFFAAPPMYVVAYMRDLEYRRSLAPAFAWARKNRGIYSDAELFDSRARDAMPFFNEVLRPHNIRSQLVCTVHFAGRVTGVIHLNREAQLFSSEDVTAVRGLMGAIGLTHAAVERAPTPLDLAEPRATPGLTQREREVALLVSRGRTNSEIADILGTALATVRHQVASIIHKCGVDNRAAVAATVQRSLLLESERPAMPHDAQQEIMTLVWRDMQQTIGQG